MSVAHRLSDMARAIVGRHCLLCDGRSTEDCVCTSCLGALPHLPEHCPRCAMPSPSSAVCGACLARTPAFDATVAAWAYQFPLDRLLIGYKFHARLELAPWFARALAPLLPAEVDGLVALPLHRTRLAERGFNQAHEIARCLSASCGIPLLEKGIVRTLATREQARLPPGARSKNMRGAFACHVGLEGRQLAVIDDVMTTGATLQEFAKTLKRAGAARVVNCVVARTLPE